MTLNLPTAFPKCFPPSSLLTSSFISSNLYSNTNKHNSPKPHDLLLQNFHPANFIPSLSATFQLFLPLHNSSISYLPTPYPQHSPPATPEHFLPLHLFSTSSHSQHYLSNFNSDQQALLLPLKFFPTSVSKGSQEVHYWDI
jgi:hypothetical protein